MVEKDYKYTKAEQETIITFNSADKTANIFSCDPTWVNKIKKFDGWTKTTGGYEVDVPKSAVKLILK